MAGEIGELDRKVLRLTLSEAQVRRFVTVPGVWPITALCYLATIDDPSRFKKSRSVGADVGLMTRRYASGETDRTGRISKCGDEMPRSYLYESANLLMTPVANMVGSQSVRDAHGEAQKHEQSAHRGGAQSGRHSASHVGGQTEFCWTKERSAMQPTGSQQRAPANARETTSLPGRG